MKKRAGIEKQNQEKPIAMTIAMQQLMLAHPRVRALARVENKEQCDE